MPNDVNWSDMIWKEINDAVLKEVFKVRVAQKVFPTKVFDNDPTEVSNGEINFTDLTIKEGDTKAFVEIYREFQLTSAQVSKEGEQKTAKTLAQMAAKEIALGEDVATFQGKDGKLPNYVKAEELDSAGTGLLGAAKYSIPVPRLTPNPTTQTKTQAQTQPDLLYGQNTFKAVTAGIAYLTEQAQAPEYALILPTEAYADTFAPVSTASLVTTADRIKPLVVGGFYGTGTLPEYQGLLAALGGEPTRVYVGREAHAEFLQKEGAKYIFRVVVRVQFVARDPRALVRLEFAGP